MITLSVYCMVSRNDRYSLEAINSIENAIKNKHIKIFYSIKEDIHNEIKNIFNKEMNFIIYQKKYPSVFDHIKALIEHCESEYILILHDDDNIGKNFLNNTFESLQKYNPDALSSRANYIDSESRILKKRKISSIKKTYKISSRKILNRYFLPFKDGQIIFPTIAFKTYLYKKYWQEDNFFIGLHEDVKIVYYFSLGNNFYENGNADNFFYRLHINQQSANKVSYDRLLLMDWIIGLKENIFYKLLLIIFTRFQYILYYKDIKLRNKKLEKLLTNARIKIINLRSGFY